MNALTRALLTLLAAGATGALLWLASARFDLHHTGGYWAAMGVVAGGGLLLGLAQLRGGGGNPPGFFLLAFLPTAIAGLWVIVAAQPHANPFRNRVRTWDGDLGITRAVHFISSWNGVLALGIGLMFGLTMEPAWVLVRSRATAPAAMDTDAADEPLTAERREVVEQPTVTRTPTRTVRS
ncbi:MAG: hypothetical protein JO186_12115 [Actinobacteria bacterium]|nr:hypothetical protein [Actinomycetota bacterium]MBV8396431.1 hypothetical protein [Actinomycetota bacterium]MBV8599617.1 hypothetical protein [Actinomycetota bacterium]